MAVTTIEILNGIRANASTEYQDRIPVATRDNVTSIGRSLTSYTPVLNEFTNLLVKLGLQIFSTKIAKNKLEPFKRGTLDNGTDIEEIFVSMAKGVAFDKEGKNPLGRRIADIKHLYHRENYQMTYEVSVSDQQVKNAFLSSNGVQSLLTDIVNSLYSGANYDEYVNTKELLAKASGDYAVYNVAIPTDETTSKEFVKSVRKAVNDMSFMSKNFNASGVMTYSDTSDLVLLLNKDVVAEIDVDVLSKAFNLGKTDFETQIIVVDDFGSMTDTFGLLVDKDFLVMYDTLRTLEPQRNAQGLFTNYFLHIWQLQSISKFKNAIAFKKPTV